MYLYVWTKRRKNVRPFGIYRETNPRPTPADPPAPVDATVPRTAFLPPPLFDRIRTTRVLRRRTEIKPFYLRCCVFVPRATTRRTRHRLQGLIDVTRNNALTVIRRAPNGRRTNARHFSTVFRWSRRVGFDVCRKRNKISPGDVDPPPFSRRSWPNAAANICSGTRKRSSTNRSVLVEPANSHNTNVPPRIDTYCLWFFTKFQTPKSERCFSFVSSIRRL